MNNLDLLNTDDLDDSFSNIRGGGGGRMGGGGMGGGGMGGGFRPPVVAPRVAPVVAPAPVAPRIAPVAPAVAPAPAPAISPARPVLTPQHRHNRMVSRYYRHNPYGGGRHRRWRISPYGLNWLGGGYGYLYGYPYQFLYPLFYDLSLGVYDELQLREKYNISDADWNTLMVRLQRDGYIFNY